MRSSLFYVIIALSATVQAAVVRSPRPDVAENDVYCDRSSGWGNGSREQCSTNKVTHRPSLPLNTSPDNFLFLTIGSRTVSGRAKCVKPLHPPAAAMRFIKLTVLLLNQNGFSNSPRKYPPDIQQIFND
ncbi:hypothetical protein K443DRAFT_126715 [Laccaria amethystina LaAM-08-1]|uniref:Uncharacterized protein n=1 Tax=Laccaria amethystina LaAM-08-1 TaxID=1095629 RepID=A0A0C9WZ07_9AGAR|nr:hypothetical protein K443DRAFT_126715 [Laccaria amethystina LaAM-08-1]